MKRGLTLGGGGSKGGYQIGAWKALRELDYKFDIVTGTSIGALNGALMVQGNFEGALALWNKAETRDVLGYESASNYESVEGLLSTYKNLTLELIKNKGLGFDALLNVIGEYFDMEEFRRSPIDYGLMTVKVPSMEASPFYKKDIPIGQEADYFCASAACFPAMKFKEIDGNLYIDGGYRDNLPIEMAVKAGATEVVVVDLAAPGVVRKINFPGVDIKYVRSKWDLGNFIIVDQDVSRRNINLGYLDTMKAFKRYEGEFYTFETAGFDQTIQDLKKGSRLFLESANIAYTEGSNYLTFKLAVTSVKKRLELDWVKDVDGDRFVLGMAEVLGKIFQISPEHIYSFDEFNKLLISKFNEEEIPYDLEPKSKADIAIAIKKSMASVRSGNIRNTLEAKFSQYKERLENFDVKSKIGSLSTNMANWQVINIKQRMSVHEMVRLIRTVPREKLVDEFSVVGILHAYDFFIGAYMQLIIEYYESAEVKSEQWGIENKE